MADLSEKVKLLSSDIENLNVCNIENEVKRNSQVAVKGVSCHWIHTVNISIEELYSLALKYLKDNEGKAVNLSYRDKLKLVAYRQQVRHGPFNIESVTPLGVFDVIGRDRRDAWQQLGDMDRNSAIIAFVKLLDKTSPAFKPFIEAQQTALEQQKLQAQLDEERKIREGILEIERQQRLKKEEEEREAAEIRQRRIQDALNAQTFEQFKNYAQEQYPDNPEQQAVLVRQLQEQHYHQYMQQLVQHQNQSVQTVESGTNYPSVADKAEQVDRVVDTIACLDSDVNGEGIPSIQPANMWTRKNIKEFKESISKDGSDSIITIEHGETITIRVPTHEDGSCVYWEFATDNYDIGFGVFFEWAKSTTNQISVHVDSEDDDEDANEDYFDDDDEYDVSDGGGVGGNDVEKGSLRSPLTVDGPPISVIVPNYRRDSHLEVYSGSHNYPGVGVYLLKFDNGYSVWRSKTLYYRVYYTRQ